MNLQPSDGVTRTLTVEKDTLREAKETAKRLREQGLWAIIIGPDGKTLDDEGLNGAGG
jgi:hypothetical protein